MKKIAIIFALLVGLWLAYIGGRKSGYDEAAQHGELKLQSISALNALGSYVAQAEIIEDIKKVNNLKKAFCSIQIYASARVMQIRQCLENANCKIIIESKVQEVAPELLNGGELKIRFFQTGEICEP